MEQQWQQGSKLPFLSILKFLYWWSEENHSIKFCLRQINMALDTKVNFEIKIAFANKWTGVVYQKSTDFAEYEIPVPAREVSFI